MFRQGYRRKIFGIFIAGFVIITEPIFSQERAMSVESFLGFACAMLILAASPGPGVCAVVSEALTGGFRASCAVITGIVLGDITFLLLAIGGLSTVASVMGELFFTIRLCGALYLLWLGLKLWTREPMSFSATLKGTRNLRQCFLGGLGITLGNPKVILFYAGFLPSFIDFTHLSAVDISLIIALVTLILAGVLGVYAFSASQARRMFRSKRAVKNLNRGAGTVMIGTGIVIATR